MRPPKGLLICGNDEQRLSEVPCLLKLQCRYRVHKCDIRGLSEAMRSYVLFGAVLLEKPHEDLSVIALLAYQKYKIPTFSTGPSCKNTELLERVKALTALKRGPKTVPGPNLYVRKRNL